MTVPIEIDRTALIVVDMQNAFCAPGGSCARLGFDIAMCQAAVAPCVRLADAARQAEIPVVLTRLIYRNDYRDGGVLTDLVMPGLAEAACCAAETHDAELIAELTPHPQDFVVDKNRYSAFYGTPLESYLNSQDIRNLVICGVTTNVCVETTARDASQRDYRTLIVRDATGEIAPERHEWALQTLGTRFGWVVDSEDILKVWERGRAVGPGA